MTTWRRQVREFSHCLCMVLENMSFSTVAAPLKKGHGWGQHQGAVDYVSAYGVLIWILAAPLPISSLLMLLVEQQRMTQVLRALSHMWKLRWNSLAPGFSLIQPSPWQPSVEWTSGWKRSTSLSLSLSFLNFHEAIPLTLPRFTDVAITCAPASQTKPFQKKSSWTHFRKTE